MELFRLPENAKMNHLNNVFQQDLDIWTESPGLLWTAEDYKTKGGMKRDSERVRRVRKFAYMVKNGDGLSATDCLAFVRSHICDESEYKARTVWEYPSTLVFIEAMYALPLI